MSENAVICKIYNLLVSAISLAMPIIGYHSLCPDHRPIIGYAPKNDEKKNSGGKGLNKRRIYKFVLTLFLLARPYGNV